MKKLVFMRPARIWAVIAAALLTGGLMLATAGTASAAPLSPSGPAAVASGTPSLPGHGTCTFARDGERVWYGGGEWECAFVLGDWPPMQWEYISL
jgi:hypothetical protein